MSSRALLERSLNHLHATTLGGALTVGSGHGAQVLFDRLHSWHGGTQAFAWSRCAPARRCILEDQRKVHFRDAVARPQVAELLGSGALGPVELCNFAEAFDRIFPSDAGNPANVRLAMVAAEIDNDVMTFQVGGCVTGRELLRICTFFGY